MCREDLHGFVAMQQPTRLVRPQGGGARSGAGQRGAAPASVPTALHTPRKEGELDKLISSIENKFQLDFNVKVGLRSPALRKSTTDNALQLIQFLFFNDRPALDDALATFAITVSHIEKEKRASALLTVLRTKTQHALPLSRSGTPFSANRVPPGSLKTSQLCKCISEHG